jgi:hypothetical protein
MCVIIMPQDLSTGIPTIPRRQLTCLYALWTGRRLTGISRHAADAFLSELQKEAFANAHELLGEVPAAAQRLWTSALKMM